MVPVRLIQMEPMLQPERDRTMKAGSWEIIGGINTVRDEYVVIGYNPKSPTPYGTWVGTIRDGIGNFNWGHYFESRETAWDDLNERLKNRI